MSRNCCPPGGSPWLRTLQTTPQNPKSLFSTAPTFEILKLLLTTSGFPSLWAQTRVSPRHSNSSFISAGDSAVFSAVTGSESFPDSGSSPQGLCFYVCSGSSFLSTRHHLSSRKWENPYLNPRLSDPRAAIIIDSMTQVEAWCLWHEGQMEEE